MRHSEIFNEKKQFNEIRDRSRQQMVLKETSRINETARGKARKLKRHYTEELS